MGLFSRRRTSRSTTGCRGRCRRHRRGFVVDVVLARNDDGVGATEIVFGAKDESAATEDALLAKPERSSSLAARNGTPRALNEVSYDRHLVGSATKAARKSDGTSVRSIAWRSARRVDRLEGAGDRCVSRLDLVRGRATERGLGHAREDPTDETDAAIDDGVGRARRDGLAENVNQDIEGDEPSLALQTGF